MEDKTTNEKTIIDIQPPARSAVVGCAVVIVVILLGLAFVLFAVYQSPYWQNFNDCMIRMQQVGDALERYAILNKDYPDSLDQLVPDYIPASMLQCPKSVKERNPEPFIYTKQPINASDEAILLTCECHKLNSKLPGAILHYTKGGNVIRNSAKDYKPGKAQK